MTISTNDNAAAKASPAAGTSDATSDPRWKATDAAEMKAFVAINITMGIINASEYADHWSTEPILHNSFVSSIMPRRRYEKLCQLVHCSLAAEEDQTDTLSKVRPLITLCQENFRRCYAPGRDLAVDEAMIEFDGRLAWKQYMPKKPVKWGIKLWCLCEATSGYCLAFTVYTGAETGVEAVTHDLGYRVVMKLMESYLHENRHVYADNYFTSVSLAKDLLAEDTYLCGTTRAHRREFPNKLASAKLKPGESIKWTNDDSVMLVKWRDRRDVYMIATNDEWLDVVRQVRRNSMPCDMPTPCCVRKYNSLMGGVDRMDQLRSYYSVGRAGRRWWNTSSGAC